MKPEMLIWVLPVSLFAIWFVVDRHSAVRLYQWLYPQRTHPNWYPLVLRVGALVTLIFMVLVLTGILK